MSITIGAEFKVGEGVDRVLVYNLHSMQTAFNILLLRSQRPSVPRKILKICNNHRWIIICKITLVHYLSHVRSCDGNHEDDNCHLVDNEDSDSLL